jgi:hypothetical protein
MSELTLTEIHELAEEIAQYVDPFFEEEKLEMITPIIKDMIIAKMRKQ